MTGLVCAGGLIFLGLLDASFNVQNGIYTSSLIDGLTAAVINLWCIVLGVTIIALTQPQVIDTATPGYRVSGATPL